MIKTVLLDLDDTILDFKKAEAEALKQTLIQLDIEPKDSTIKRYSEINESLWKLLEKGQIERSRLLVKRFEILFEELGVERCGKLAWNTYEGLLSSGHFFVDGALEVLEILKDNYDLYIVSNGTATVQEKRIKSADISKYFKEIFISQQIGYNKPRLEFFEECFKHIPNFTKDETIIVGDSLSSDIKGGINAGIHTCWFNLRKNPSLVDIVPEYTIDKISELPNLLKRI